MEVKCFMIEPMATGPQWLRRYASGDCGGRRYHNAMIRIGDCKILTGADGCISPERPEYPRDDPRWPRSCEACGRPFEDRDEWQLFYEQWYRMPDGSSVCIRWDLPGVPHAPPGAMWYSDWYWRKGPDGRCLSVILPDGVTWMIDGPSNSGGDGWTREGAPPLVTANPSILTAGYHGWLRSGVLIEC